MVKYLCFLLFLYCSVTLHSQERKVYYGLYNGLGIGGTDNWESRFSYEVGTSFLIQKKKNASKSFREPFIQFSHNRCYASSKKDNPDLSQDSTYSISHRNLMFLQLGFKWNVSLYANEKFNILLSTGFLVGELLTDSYTRNTYYYSDNSLKKSSFQDAYSPVRTTWGFTFGIKNMISLSERWLFTIDLNLLIQSSIEYDPSVDSNSYMMKTGIYYQLGKR